MDRLLGRACIELLPRLRHLAVDRLAIEVLADRLAAEPPPAPRWEPPVFPEEPGPWLDAVIWLGNALNFSYWVDGAPMWSVELDGCRYEDAFALYGSLHLALREGLDLLDGRVLLSGEAARVVLGRGSGELPLLRERAAILEELGRILLYRFDGRLENAVAAAGRDAASHALFLARTFPSFRDSRQLEGRVLHFLKRAQLAAAQLHGALRARGASGLSGLGHLTLFADYMLPRSLRALGVLRYGPELARRVDGRELLQAGSRLETELRVATVAAGQLLLAALRERGSRIGAVELDAWLWRTGFGIEAPHHRVRCTDY